MASGGSSRTDLDPLSTNKTLEYGSKCQELKLELQSIMRLQDISSSSIISGLKMATFYGNTIVLLLCTMFSNHRFVK